MSIKAQYCHSFDANPQECNSVNNNYNERNYLLSSVRNNSIRHLNKLSLHQQHNKQFMIEEMIMSDSHITIEHEEADEVARVESLLNQLPERSRQITFMSRIEEKKNNEIAN